jgi:Protein of unknown function (DUF642)/PEP-CTERM motif
MKTTLIRYTLVTLAAVMLTSVAQAQLILNGSFESSGITGTITPSFVYYNANNQIANWTIYGGDINANPSFTQVTIHNGDLLGDLVGGTFSYAQDGTYYLDLSGQGTHATIYQDFATVPDTQYELSFYIGASSDHPPAATINVKLDGIASLLNNTLTPNAPTTHIDWSLQTFLFTADSSTTRLSFLDVGPSGNGSYTDNNTSFVDNIRVTAVPEPSTYGMFLGAGMLGLAFLRHRPTLPR